MNKLYFGDNLEILRDKIPSDCVDLIYLDPPFQSGKNYNQIFQPQAAGIKGATAQITAFEDTWTWGEEAEKEYQGLITGTITQEKPGQKLIDLLKAMRAYLGECPMMAYLAMMAPRLVEMQRVLKDTGSIYLHCDQTASHYLKLLMDAVFGVINFKSEIIWKRKTGRGDTGGTSRRFGDMVDNIVFYSKTENNIFNHLYRPNDPEYIKNFFKFIDENGRRYAADNLASPSTRPNLTYEYKGYKPPAKGWAVSSKKMEEMDKAGLLIFPKTKEGGFGANDTLMNYQENPYRIFGMIFPL